MKERTKTVYEVTLQSGEVCRLLPKELHLLSRYCTEGDVTVSKKSYDSTEFRVWFGEY